MTYTNALDLDALLAKTNASFGHTPLRTPSGVEFQLRNALQLDKALRDQISDLGDAYAESNEEGFEGEAITFEDHIKNTLRIVADNGEAFEEYLDAVGENVAALVTLFRVYNEGTQAGEA